jgi:GNAT superfamily N-acetyltransferase
LLAFTTREDTEVDRALARNALEVLAETDSGVRVRQMDDADLERIMELRSVVRWAADPRAFDLLRGVRGARWAVAEAPDGALTGMVGAVPLGEIGILCHLAVHDGYRGSGLGALLSSWAVAYLRSRGAKTVRLYSTRKAEGLYRSLGFGETAPRTVYRLEEGHLRPSVPARVNGHRVETLTFGDLPELYGVDQWSYGADRSALLFATLRLHPGRGLVARDSSGGIKGYLIRSALGRTTRIGPLLASSPDVARFLLTPTRSRRPAEHRPRSRSPDPPNVTPTPSCKSSASRVRRTASGWSWEGRKQTAGQGSSTTARRRIWLPSCQPSAVSFQLLRDVLRA